MLLLHVLLWFWLTSPSSRRAWIEITPAVAKKARRGVALLAEGVDRNLMSFHTVCRARWSPSSRRAWIEIKNCLLPVVVKMSPSSRRAWIEIAAEPRGGVRAPGRPPRGGRG